MTQIGSAAFAGRAASGSVAILRNRVRALLALSSRKRYRRGSTSSTGQVLPLTVMVLPKNSGFQIGDTSVFGMNGPSGGTSPKKPRLAGKNSEPLRLKDRSCKTSGISYGRAGSTPGGRSAG